MSNDHRHHYRPDIDGLRAIAVAGVVIFHCFPSLLKGGFVGVDIFFVISGYLITKIIVSQAETGIFSFTDFYTKRIKRIFPALLTVISVVYGFAWLSLFPEEFKLLGKHIVGGSLFLSNFFLYNEVGYFDVAADTKPLLHLWSLAIEEQFYIFWPILILLSIKWKKNPLLLAALIIPISFIANLWFSKYEISAAFYLPHARAWELLLGAVVAIAQLRSAKPQLSHNHSGNSRPSFIKNLTGFAFFTLIASLFAINKGKVFPGWWVLLPVISTALLIAITPSGSITYRILSHPWLRTLGLISYPLYLWHWPLLAYARIIQGTNPNVWIRGAVIPLSLILAWVTYKFIEKPLRYGKHNTPILGLLCGGMLLASLLGSITYLKNGLPMRAAISNFKSNTEELQRSPEKDQDCQALMGNKAASIVYCRFSDAGSEEIIALIGDSHAHTLFPGFAKLLANKKQSLVLLANSGCPPYIGSVSGNTTAIREACENSINDLINILTTDKRIKRVYISTRGAVYVTGNGWGELEKDYVNQPIVAAKSALQLSGATASNIFLMSAQKTIDTLNAAQKKVFFITENPELGLDPASCLTRPFKAHIKNCQIQTAEVLNRQQSYREIVKKLNGAEIIDLIPILCNSESCKVFSAGKLLYADDDHLSYTGSDLIAQFALLPTLGKNHHDTPSK